MPVGKWVMRTAESVLLMCCPPAPLARKVSMRKGLIGSGDRSDRIRTYNFPQGRLTDHRINLTLYKLTTLMEGDLQEVIDALQHAHEAEQLQALEDRA